MSLFKPNCKNCFSKFLYASDKLDWNVWGKAFPYGKFEKDNGCPCIDANLDTKNFTKIIEPNARDAFYSTTHYTVIVESKSPRYAGKEV